MYLYICQQIEIKMNKYRITNPNNKEVRECKSRTTGDNYTNKEEQFNIENNENVIAKKYNMLERKTHKGENYKEIKTDSPISNKKIE